MINEEQIEKESKRILNISPKSFLGGRYSYHFILGAKWMQEQQPEWISVEDRLPVDEREYLVCNTRFDPPIVYSSFCQFNLGDAEFYSAGESEPDEITHWMPLPEPPKQ